MATISRRPYGNLCVLLFLIHSVSAFAQYDDGARYAFLGSRSEKAVYVVDLQARKKVDKIRLAVGPDNVSASQALKALIIGHADAKFLTLVDLQSKDLGQYKYSLDLRPDTVLVSPIGETAAVLDRNAGVLQVHALKRREILANIDNVNTGTDLTFNPDGSTVYWVDQESGTLHSVDLWSEQRQLKLARDGAALSAMTRSVDGTLGFVSNADNDTVSVIRLRDFRTLRVSRVGDSPRRAWGTADGQYMLVPNAASGTVTAISTLTSESIYTVNAVENPVSINPGWIDTIAAVVGRNGNVAFISIDDGTELARIQLEDMPEAGIVTSDSKTLAVPVPASGSIVFFDMQKHSRLSTINALARDIGPAALAISNNLCH